MANSSPCIILVNPQMGENIGAAARAMLNFGLIDLRLVAPRDGWPNQAAIDMSVGAFNIIPPAQVFNTLPEAIDDLHYTYATTARTRDMVKPVFTSDSAATDAQPRTQSGQNIGFIFGPERTGLTNDDLSLCSATITIPTNPDFSSLNLGQSVLLIANEWHKTNDKSAPKTLDMGDSFPVEHKQLQNLLIRLEDELEQKNFFREKALKPTMIRNIRNIFTRAELSNQEAQTLHGIISALIGNKL